MKTTSLLNLIAGLASITAIGAVQLVLAPASPLPRRVLPRVAELSPSSEPLDGPALTALERQLDSR